MNLTCNYIVYIYFFAANKKQTHKLKWLLPFTFVNLQQTVNSRSQQSCILVSITQLQTRVTSHHTRGQSVQSSAFFHRWQPRCTYNHEPNCVLPMVMAVGSNPGVEVSGLLQTVFQTVNYTGCARIMFFETLGHCFNNLLGCNSSCDHVLNQSSMLFCWHCFDKHWTSLQGIPAASWACT